MKTEEQQFPLVIDKPVCVSLFPYTNQEITKDLIVVLLLLHSGTGVSHGGFEFVLSTYSSDQEVYVKPTFKRLDYTTTDFARERQWNRVGDVALKFPLVKPHHSL